MSAQAESGSVTPTSCRGCAHVVHARYAHMLHLVRSAQVQGHAVRMTAPRSMRPECQGLVGDHTIVGVCMLQCMRTTTHVLACERA